MGDVRLYRKSAQRIGHIAASCDEYIVMYGGYLSGPDGEEYHAADSVAIFNTETKLWQYRVLQQIPWKPEPQAGRRGERHEESKRALDGRTVAAEQATAGEISTRQLARASGSCGVHVADEHVLYVYGGHSPEGKLSGLLGIDLRRLTCWRLPDGPLSVDKLAGWHWNSRLYFFGGYGRKPAVGGCGDCLVDITSLYGFVWLNELVSFDISRGTWRYESATGTPPSPRAAHAAVRVGTKVYVFGGRSGATRLNDLHILDLPAMRWSGRVAVAGEELVRGRSWHSLTDVGGEHLLLYGGFSTEQHVLGDLWLLNVSELTWTRINRGATPPSGEPSLWHTATYSPASESVVIFGGCTRNVLGLSERDDDDPLTCTATVFNLSPPSLFRLCMEAVRNMDLTELIASRLNAATAQLQPLSDISLPRMIVQKFARLSHSDRLLAATEDNSEDAASSLSLLVHAVEVE